MPYEFMRNDHAARFINPFNFVPINPNSVSRPQEKPSLQKESLHTGMITCKVSLRTPLIIPDTEHVQLDYIKQGHNRYPFMTDEAGNPMIPGSSLRGPIRSVYETYTDSCFVTIRKSNGNQGGQDITARTNQAYKPGLLVKKDGQIELRSAKRYIFAVDDYKPFSKEPNVCHFSLSTLKKEKFRYGDHLCFFPLKEGTREKSYRKNGIEVGTFIEEINGKWTAQRKLLQGECHGYLYLGEVFPRKHFESIFCDRKEESAVCDDQEMLDNAISKLRSTLEVYRNPSVNKTKNHTGYRQIFLDSFLEGKAGTLPIWYRIENEKLYLSAASLGRFGYDNSVNRLVGKKDACRDRRNLCKACSMFGMVGKEGEGSGSFGSRIRFTDAKWTGGQIKTKYETLRELGTPRTSYLPFYGKNPDREGGVINHYDSLNGGIAGRKYYWHSIPMNYTGDPGKQTATMEILQEGEFSFRIYYDELTEIQRNELLWVLCLGDNDKMGKACHKIGHGKPLGFGSVKITLEEMRERIFKDGTYREDITEEKEFSDLIGEVYMRRNDELDMILDFTAIQGGPPVEYPSVVSHGRAVRPNDAAAHHWFSENYKFGREKAQYYLPKIKRGKDMSLPKIEYLE